MVSYKANSALIEKMQQEKQQQNNAAGSVKQSGATPENEKRIRGLNVAKRGLWETKVSSKLAWMGSAIAQAARAGRNRLRGGK